MKVKLWTDTGTLVLDGARFDTARGVVSGRAPGVGNVAVPLETVRRQRLLADAGGKVLRSVTRGRR